MRHTALIEELRRLADSAVLAARERTIETDSPLYREMVTSLRKAADALVELSVTDLFYSNLALAKRLIAVLERIERISPAAHVLLNEMFERLIAGETPANVMAELPRVNELLENARGRD